MAVITTPTSASGQVNLTGTDQDDTINAYDYANVRQTHVYAGNGDDVINMYFGEGDRYRPDWLSQHKEYQGHHVRGGNGHDVFNFGSLSSVTGTVIGRIEDLDLSRDVIQIEGAAISSSDLARGYGQTSGYNWKVVEWNGDHNDPNSSPQQWLLIDTGDGWVFYSLEGARVDVTGNGSANSGDQEGHFFTVAPPDFASMASVGYIDPINVVPEKSNGSDYLPSNGGVLINDVDVDGSDVAQVIQGTGGNDVIAAGLNDDSVEAGGGSDRLWGGSGNDSLYGDNGNDTIHGGIGEDRIVGGKGNDRLYGENGNDLLNGGEGSDIMTGGSGADIFEFKSNDLKDWDNLSGSWEEKNDQLDLITDFAIGADRIEFDGSSNVNSMSDLKAWKTTIDGNVHFTVQVRATNERILVDVDDSTSWSQFFDSGNFLFT